MENSNGASVAVATYGCQPSQLRTGAAPATMQQLLQAISDGVGDQHRRAMLRTTVARIAEMANTPLEQLSIEFLVELTPFFNDFLTQRRYSSNSVRTYCHCAKQLLQIAIKLGWKSESQEITEPWVPVVDSLKESRRAAMSIVRYAIRNGKDPSTFSDSDLNDWREWMQRRGRKYTTVRQAVQRFRRAVRKAHLQHLFPRLSWPLSPIARRYRVNISDMPEPIRSEVLAVLKWKQDRYAKGRPSKGRHRAVTAALLEKWIARLYGFAVKIDGRQNVASLGDLVTEEIVSSFVSWAVNERNLAHKTIMKLYMLYSVMRHYPKYQHRDWTWLSNLLRELPPDQESLYLETKARKYAPYDSLAEIPKRVRASSGHAHDGNLRAMWRDHDALLIDWLLTLPWRQRNLRECRLGDPETANVFFAELPALVHVAKPIWAEEALTKNPHEKFWQFFFREHETKTGHAVRGFLPRRLVAPLEKYLEEQRPKLITRPEINTLFLNRTGVPLHQHELTDMVGQYALTFTSRRVTPHLWRDVFAYKWLDDNPEDYLTLSKVLWHRDINTTLKIYGRKFDESNGARRVDEWLSSQN